MFVSRWFAVDSDDGSYKCNVTSNVIVWGGCKNHLSADKGCGPDDVILCPGASARDVPPLDLPWLPVKVQPGPQWAGPGG